MMEGVVCAHSQTASTGDLAARFRDGEQATRLGLEALQLRKDLPSTDKCQLCDVWEQDDANAPPHQASATCLGVLKSC